MDIQKVASVTTATAVLGPGALGTAAVTQTGIASVPIVGWVLAGAATMIGMDQGAEIGGQMAGDLAKECQEDIDISSTIEE